VARPLRLEQLARRLTGNGPHDSAQRLVTVRVDLVVRVRASMRSMLQPPLAPVRRPGSSQGAAGDDRMPSAIMPRTCALKRVMIDSASGHAIATPGPE